MSDANNENLIEMYVAGILLDPVTQAPVVIMQSQDGKTQLPIWIGMAEATAIATVLKKIKLNRPLTHDLMISALTELNIDIQQAVISRLEDSVYYAEIVLSDGEKGIILDCRPSDAISIALRTDSPILVAKDILDSNVRDNMIKKLKGALARQDEEGSEGEQKAQKSEEKPAEKAAEAEGQTEEEQKLEDFRYIDKSKWKDILQELDADDFKYKT